MTASIWISELARTGSLREFRRVDERCFSVTRETINGRDAGLGLATKRELSVGDYILMRGPVVDASELSDEQATYMYTAAYASGGEFAICDLVPARGVRVRGVAMFDEPREWASGLYYDRDDQAALRARPITINGDPTIVSSVASRINDPTMHDERVDEADVARRTNTRLLSCAVRDYIGVLRFIPRVAVVVFKPIRAGQWLHTHYARREWRARLATGGSTSGSRPSDGAWRRTART